MNKRRKLSMCAAPSHLRLHDFILKKRDRQRSAPPVNLKVSKSVSNIVLWYDTKQCCLYQSHFSLFNVKGKGFFIDDRSRLYLE